MTQEEIKQKLGRKWRQSIQELYDLCKVYSKCGNISIPISTTSGHMYRKYKCERKISRLLTKAIDIGLLNVESKDIAFNHFNREDNYCRIYTINEDIANVIKSFTNVSYMQIRNKERRENYNINIDLNLEISNNKEYELNLEDDELNEQILKSYPQIDYYNNYLDYINSTYEGIEGLLYTYFYPRVHHRADNKVYFGIRAWSTFCSLPKKPNTRCCWRSQVLDCFFGENNWKEYDINGSIFRVAKSLKEGKWYDGLEDIYRELHKAPFRNKDARNKFKVTCNIVNFCKDMKKACAAYRDKFRSRAKNVRLLPVMNDLKKRITESYGEFDSEIFLHESCIYIGALYRLIKAGYNAVMLYDAIYLEHKGKTDEEISEMLRIFLNDSFNEYYNKFIK